MSTKQLLALLTSHVDGDEEQVLAIPLQIAAQEARQGRADDADRLKRLVQKARDQQRAGRPAATESGGFLLVRSQAKKQTSPPCLLFDPLATFGTSASRLMRQRPTTEMDGERSGCLESREVSERTSFLQPTDAAPNMWSRSDHA